MLKKKCCVLSVELIRGRVVMDSVGNLTGSRVTWEMGLGVPVGDICVTLTDCSLWVPHSLVGILDCVIGERKLSSIAAFIVVFFRLQM